VPKVYGLTFSSIFSLMVKVGVSQCYAARQFSIFNAFVFLCFFFSDVNRLPIRRWETAKENNFKM